MLKDEIGILHACLAQAFLALLVLIALATSRLWRTHVATLVDPANVRSIRRIALFATVAIYMQLGLGATMRHQHRDLAILDFPTANGAWLPDTSAKALAAINTWRNARGLSDVTAFQIWLQMAHRFLAVLIAVGVVAVCFRVWKDMPHATSLKRLSLAWVALLFVQITLGAWTIWSNKAADVATAHVAVGATMLCFGVSICALCWRILQTLPQKESALQALEPKPVLAT
jgi:cytochrome c oxidase assembly protein subunit 15